MARISGVDLPREKAASGSSARIRSISSVRVDSYGLFYLQRQCALDSCGCIVNTPGRVVHDD